MSARSATAGARVGSAAPTVKKGHVEGASRTAMEILSPLLAHDRLKVKQGMEFKEFLLALECPNAYVVTDDQNKPIYAVKELWGGPLRWFERLFFRQARPFTMTVLDANKKQVMHFERPLRPILSRMTIYGPDNAPLGTIQRRFKFFGEKYELRCPNGHHLATVRAWTLGPRHFTVRKGFRKIGSVQKRFAGLFHEGWTKADKYEIQWPHKKVAKLGLSSEAELQLHALLLGCGFLIDYDAFDA